MHELITPFSGPVALKALIQNDEGKVLVCLNNHPGEPWDLPGGKMNAGEHPYEALVREVKEELNLDIKVVGAVAADHFIKRDTGMQTVVIALLATLVHPEMPIVLADDELSEARWIGKDELESLEIFPEYRAFLERHFAA